MEKEYKPTLIIDNMVKKSKQQPDWIALILLGFGVVAIYQGNNVGFFFLIFALIKYFWSI